MTKKVLTKDGEWKQGSAAPELLAPELRSLPSEVVTKDFDDPDKVVNGDERHVRETIVEDWAKKGVDHQTPWVHGRPVDIRSRLFGEDKRLTQDKVDFIRAEVVVQLERSKRYLKSKGKPMDVAKRWVIFHEDNVDDYEMVMQDPVKLAPHKEHLKGLDLVIDNKSKLANMQLASKLAERIERVYRKDLEEIENEQQSSIIIH